MIIKNKFKNLKCKDSKNKDLSLNLMKNLNKKIITLHNFRKSYKSVTIVSKVK